MRVVILTHDSAASEYVRREIAACHEVVGVFIEKSAGSKIQKAFRQFKRNRRRKGQLTALARFLELPFVIWLNSSYQRRQKKFFSELIDEKIPSFPVYSVKNVNDDEVVAQIRALAPDAICVFGSSVLRAPVISVPDRGVLNMHASLLPSYRGAKSEFWALANGEPDQIGVTVHLIDEGVDTGPILAQAATRVEPGDDDRRLRCKNVVAGTRLLLETLDRLADGTARPLPQDPARASSYSTPTLSAYFRMKSYVKKLLSS